MLILIHPVNFSCGRKPKNLEKTHDIQQSVDTRTHDLRVCVVSHRSPLSYSSSCRDVIILTLFGNFLGAKTNPQVQPSIYFCLLYAEHRKYYTKISWGKVVTSRDVSENNLYIMIGSVSFLLQRDIYLEILSNTYP